MGGGGAVVAPARTMFHIKEEKVKKEFLSMFIKNVLPGTIKTTNILSKLRGYPAVLERVHDFAVPMVNERDFYYKIIMKLCMGGEGVWVEALEQQENGNEDRGDDGRMIVSSLNNNLIGGAQFCLTKDFLKEHAWDQNEEDGSYLNEGQLRKLWKEYAVPRFCDSRRCRGMCCALPGDSVFHYEGEPDCVKYEPATQEELKERGFLSKATGEGQLSAQARMAREDPSQLEGDDED